MERHRHASCMFAPYLYFAGLLPPQCVLPSCIVSCVYDVFSHRSSDLPTHHRSIAAISHLPLQSHLLLLQRSSSL